MEDKNNSLNWEEVEQYLATDIILQAKTKAKRWFYAWVFTLAALIGSNATWVYLVMTMIMGQGK